MRTVIMKIGTLSSYYYFVRDTKKINGTEFSVGQKITFREQGHGSKWQHGTITHIKSGMPFVALD